MVVRVECYAGHRGEETPRAFFLDARRVEVAEVLDRWHGIDHRYFKVRGADGGLYILRHDTSADRWEITLFQQAGTAAETAWPEPTRYGEAAPPIRALPLALAIFRGTAPADVAALIEELAGLGLHVTRRTQAELPPEAFDLARGQYRGSGVLTRIQPEPGERVLAVTEADLYDDGLNFIFGLADPGRRVALISFHRLRLLADPWTFRARAAKAAVHELGHTLGLSHCSDPACVMFFSNTLADTDRKGARFCPRCHRGLSWH
ncbi:MAG TPA: archaemetzincin family Zn-dependent metalloprotease [Nitrospiria bacterium]|nr:archaemetzincin family Zn-dependent metalloprotease [Nitrospiria bacterium]